MFVGAQHPRAHVLVVAIVPDVARQHHERQVRGEELADFAELYRRGAEMLKERIDVEVVAKMASRRGCQPLGDAPPSEQAFDRRNDFSCEP